MASSLDVKKITSKVAVTAYDLDPDGTGLTDVGWVDMRDRIGLMVMFFRTVGTSAIVFNIVANTASDGSGDEAIIKTITPAAAPDAVGDYVFGEILAEEVAQQASTDGKAYRYVSANISFATGTDEAVVVYTAMPNRFNYDGLTSDVVA